MNRNDAKKINKIIGKINAILNQYSRYMQRQSRDTYIAYLRLLEAKKILESVLESITSDIETMERIKEYFSIQDE